MKDFFVSYNKADKKWAEWIAWMLEEAGYSVVIQAWDFQPGCNFVLEMQQALSASRRTIALLSDAYLNAEFTHPEWAAAFARDPQCVERSLVPIRIEQCNLTGLLAQVVYVDIVDLPELEAKSVILKALSVRARPHLSPVYPGNK